jgi:hypothetical protein
LFSQSVYAGEDFIYTSNVSLSNAYVWTANAFLTTLDLLDVFNGNSEIGILTTNLQPIINNTPNSVNYTLSLSAPGSLTSQWIANSVNINERVLYLFTKFTSNSGNIVTGNTAILRVMAAVLN